MRRTWLAAWMVCLALPALGRAETDVDVPTIDPVFLCCDACANSGRTAWLHADYLLWWIRPGPVAAPLVTTGVDDGSGITPGALGRPQTRVLFGDRDLDFESFSGLRLRAGQWLDNDETRGLEFSYFGLERRSVIFTAASDAGGNPFLARPFINAFSGNPTALLSASPGEIAGNIAIEAPSRLWGWEVNYVGRPDRDSAGQWLVGFRALDLTESLRVLESIAPLTPTPIFQGQVFGPPAVINAYDGFHTSNHFYGPQLGGRTTRALGAWNLEMYGKVAVGWTEQRARIEGNTTLFAAPGAAPQSIPGGVAAQPSNIGDHERTRFGFVPEVGVNLTRQLTDNLRMQFGYTFIHWNSVLRPGAQIDPVLSDSLIPTSPFFGAPGPTDRPAFGFHDSAFWTQGINIGVLWQF